MTPQEKINWFWSTGVLPGTIFDDWGDQKREPVNARRRISLLRLLSLGLLG